MTEGFWATCLKENWGFAARLTRLAGEYDLNFMAEIPDGRSCVLKIMRAGCDPALVDLQIAALAHLAGRAPGLPVPLNIPASDGRTEITLRDPGGSNRLVWLQQALPGQIYARAAPKTRDLILRLGRVLGATDRALEGFDHPALTRDLKWNLLQADWISVRLGAIADPARQALLSEIRAGYDAIRPALAALPPQAIHNDANDHNILVEGGLRQPGRISGLVDFGDMCAAPRICELAIAGAYVVLDHPKPERALGWLVAGYHAANPLTEAEVALIWPLLRMRLAVSVVNSALEAASRPDDPYVTVTQAPAWRLLENRAIDGALVTARLRLACGLPVTRHAGRVRDWLDRGRGGFAPLLGGTLDDAPAGALSVADSTVPRNPFATTAAEAAAIGADMPEIWLGRYGEPRLVYTAPGFRNGPLAASDRRTVHIAADVFAPAGSVLHAPLGGTVALVETRDQELDYGGVAILRHETPAGDVFHTLYGHLDPEICDRLRPGDRVKAGEGFARLGTPAQNGGWAPHVHFQLALETAGMERDWPGVADPDDRELWQALCPNPAALLNLPDDRLQYTPPDRARILADRQASFGANLALSYDDPVMLLRGWRHHLFDEWGRPYLDAYNNVPHVGHAHPRIRAVAADQLLRINSNTRYLHPAQTEFAQTLLAKLPEPLEVCFFVNSGSEANELALRLARAHSGARGIVTPDHGYHGMTTGAVDISAYKFDAPGGGGRPDWVELVELPDDFRGSFRRDDPERATKFAALVGPAIDRLAARGHPLAGFIAETFPSVGGQIVPPPGYLPAVYDLVRAAGGVCIADEVQTGLGRLGRHYFGFEHQGAVPDIVVLGKPIGNGHPLGVVITTRAIADSFAHGPEFFSTFGGSTLSCRIGTEVLRIVEDEGLQANAAVMGDRLLDGLRAIARDHPCIGDLRGMGLFVGVELVWPDGSGATELCAYVKNRMREHRILIGSEGPMDNILKIRPPLTIGAEDVDMLLWALRSVLDEPDVLSAPSPPQARRHHHHPACDGC